MQDNAPIHTYKAAMAWLKDTGFTVMDWPLFSPDLNPIENLWFPLKEQTHFQVPQLHKVTNPEACIAQLTAVLPEAWQRIPQEKHARLIESLPRRIQAVIEANGSYTSY